MDEIYRLWLREKTAEQCVQNLKRNGFDAHFVQDEDAAQKRILDLASAHESFGFGGSSTVRGLGVVESLAEMGKTIFDHWPDGLSPEQEMAMRLGMGRCDCFLCSANAVSMTGEIVNVDGVGNRVAAMTFGPKQVVIVAGMNKVAPDLASALRRVREVAAPMRAKSLNKKTPCAETGICSDCQSPQRICRITTILHRRPVLTQISVILVNRELGF